MAVRILKDEEQGYSCLYCSTTMQVFGQIFYEDDDPDEFLEWLGVDPRMLTDKDLYNKFYEWKELKDNPVEPFPEDYPIKLVTDC